MYSVYLLKLLVLFLWLPREKAYFLPCTTNSESNPSMDPQYMEDQTFSEIILLNNISILIYQLYNYKINNLIIIIDLKIKNNKYILINLSSYFIIERVEYIYSLINCMIMNNFDDAHINPMLSPYETRLFIIYLRFLTLKNWFKSY